MAERRVVRTTSAPTRLEAETMMRPLDEAFRAAGWEEEERLWVPGERRPSLGESLLLSPESELLLEGDGSLRVVWRTTDDARLEPTLRAGARQPDLFEELGGTRYRRLAPRWMLGALVGTIALIIMIALVGGAAGGRLGPFGGPGEVLTGYPPAADGTCREGYRKQAETAGTEVCWPADAPVFSTGAP